MNKARPTMLILLATTACMTPANPPSLARRAIESQSDAATAAPTPLASKPANPSVVAKLAAVITEARAGDDAFIKTDQAGTAALSAGRSATAGSEPWIAAELIKSALQIARQRSADALGAVDALSIEQLQAVATDRAASGFDEIEVARTVIETIVNRQTARLDALAR